jgi:bisphosphoglycerate-independent phosphoglycerate mutase (AlkP superfamily)
MVGHLLPARYEEAKAAYRAAADALVEMAQTARTARSFFVVTSDHGNIENDTSAHSVNDVLTTIVRPDSAKSEVAIPVFQARLFDIAPTLFKLMGAAQNGAPAAGPADQSVGRPLVVTG